MGRELKMKKKNKSRRRNRRRKLRCIRNFSMAVIFAGLLSIFALTLSAHNSDTAVYDYNAGASSYPENTSAATFQTTYSVTDGKEDNTSTIITELAVIDVRLDADTESRLALLAGEDSEIAEIYAARDSYPAEVLTALVNNLELKEFVRGYLTADGTAQGGLSEEEMAQAYPLFLQWDSRWGYVPYGKTNIGISGCGPTCMSMVIFALTRNASATPDALASYSMDNGYYSQGAGTTWLFMTDAAKKYGLCANELGLDESVMKQYLDMGHPIICAMRPGDFTTVGHFIMIYGYDENGFLINDPNSRERSGKHWDFDTLHYQIKNLWGYYKA